MPQLTPSEVDALLVEAGEEFGIDPLRLRAILQHESGGDWNARGPVLTEGPYKGQQALGGFQLMPDTAKAYGADPFDPKQATRAAAQLLRDNYAQTQDWDETVKQYFGGPNPKNHGPKTEAYLKKHNEIFAGLGGENDYDKILLGSSSQVPAAAPTATPPAKPKVHPDVDMLLNFAPASPSGTGADIPSKLNADGEVDYGSPRGIPERGAYGLGRAALRGLLLGQDTALAATPQGLAGMSDYYDLPVKDRLQHAIRGMMSPETQASAERSAPANPLVAQAWQASQDAYAKAYAEDEAAREAFAAANPTANTLAEVAGSLPTAALGGIGTAKAAVGAARTAMPAIANALQNALTKGGILSKGATMVGLGAAEGAASGALTSGLNDESVLENALTGAKFGAAMRPAFGYGKDIAVSAYNRMLAAKAELATLAESYGIKIPGISITQNEFAKNVEAASRGLPFYPARNTEAEAKSSFTRAVVKNLGEDGDQINADVMNRARSRIGAAYEKALGEIGEVHLTSEHIEKLKDLFKEASRQGGSKFKSVIDDFKQALRAAGPPSPKPTPVAELPDFSKLKQSKDLRISQMASEMDETLTKIPPITPTRREFGIADLDETLPRPMYINAEDWRKLTRFGGPLSKLTRSSDSDVKGAAVAIDKFTKELLYENAPNEGVAKALREANSRYKAMKAVEDLSLTKSSGWIDPTALEGSLKKSYGDLKYTGTDNNLDDLGKIGKEFFEESSSKLGARQGVSVGTLGFMGGTHGALLGTMLGGGSGSIPGAVLGSAATIGAGSVAGRYLHSDLYRNRLINSMRKAGVPPSEMGNMLRRLSVPTVVGGTTAAKD